MTSIFLDFFVHLIAFCSFCNLQAAKSIAFKYKSLFFTMLPSPSLFYSAAQFSCAVFTVAGAFPACAHLCLLSLLLTLHAVPELVEGSHFTLSPPSGGREGSHSSLFCCFPLTFVIGGAC